MTLGLVRLAAGSCEPRAGTLLWQEQPRARAGSCFEKATDLMGHVDAVEIPSRERIGERGSSVNRTSVRVENYHRSALDRAKTARAGCAPAKRKAADLEPHGPRHGQKLLE